MRYLQAVLFAHALLLAAVSISEGAQLDIAPSGNGRFVVTGSALDGVAGLDLTIAYDAASLGKPVISQGALLSGATMAVNTNNPGMIRIAIISGTALSGSGQLVAIAFSGQSGGGSISSAKATMINSRGAAIPSSFTISSGSTGSAGSADFLPAAGVPFSNSARTGQEQGQQPTRSSSGATTTTTSATTSTAAAPSIGTISLYGEPSSPAKPQTTAEPSPPDYQQGEKATQPTPPAARGEDQLPAGKEPQPEPTKKTEIKQLSYSDILERFRNFKGERTLAAFTELFAKPVAEKVRQEPAIAISNGNSTVKIFLVKAAIAANSLPTVATKGAKLLSLKYDDLAGGLVIELTPHKNELQAAVSILFDSSITEIPLVLVPPPGKLLAFTQSETAAFLKDNGATKPLFDLNSDGKHDYLDDYIYTGHNLLNKKTGQDKPGATRAPAK